jgi:hypothetical protein
VSRYITLGADKNGNVYGLEVNDDGTLRRNSLGYSTSCAVIRPVTKENYEYLTENPQSAKEHWQQAVQADETEKGLDDWFNEIDKNELIDKSFVFELLEDDDNPTVSKHKLSIRKRMDEVDETDESDDIVSSDGIWDEDGQPMPFRRRVELALVESDEVSSVNDVNDVYCWEASGWFAPKRPFVVEFAPKELLEEYYAHLRKTYKEFEG